MATVSFIQKPNGKKVARISKYMRAIYDGEKVILRYDTTRTLIGRIQRGATQRTIEATLDNFIAKSKRLCAMEYIHYTLEPDVECFEFVATEDGYHGEYGDIVIRITKDGKMNMGPGTATHVLYKGDIEGSIRDLVGASTWQKQGGGNVLENSNAYKMSRTDVLSMFKKGHVLWTGSRAINTSTTSTQPKNGGGSTAKRK